MRHSGYDDSRRHRRASNALLRPQSSWSCCNMSGGVASASVPEQSLVIDSHFYSLASDPSDERDSISKVSHGSQAAGPTRGSAVWSQHEVQFSRTWQAEERSNTCDEHGHRQGGLPLAAPPRVQDQYTAHFGHTPDFEWRQVCSSDCFICHHIVELEADAEEPDAPQPWPGSVGHARGVCKPCAHFWKSDGCYRGAFCEHCHECGEDDFFRYRRQRRRRVRDMPSDMDGIVGIVDMD
eukprot:TRINITY_DN30988_c0_g1_i1.p2 TRINITY_DN30988_c0_g1~~TRINITY_DN30988_c0_g1_i1.p2  ORF type:complete len:237 (-),score=13.38 TRINITY_DN30988_c0_g1_i1:393-1103(-)